MLICTFMTLLMLLSLGAGVTPAQAESPPACPDPRSRQFDFWIGEWEVTADGVLAGHNRIEPILDGCVLQESWRGAKGSAGSSFNFFNPISERWQQFWVWRDGTTLELEGAFADAAMVLEGESTSRDGKRLLNRITWHVNKDGTLRQHWETSSDAGSSWTTAFDGLYRKKAVAPGR